MFSKISYFGRKNYRGNVSLFYNPSFVLYLGLFHNNKLRKSHPPCCQTNKLFHFTIERMLLALEAGISVEQCSFFQSSKIRKLVTIYISIMRVCHKNCIHYFEDRSDLFYLKKRKLVRNIWSTTFFWRNMKKCHFKNFFLFVATFGMERLNGRELFCLEVWFLVFFCVTNIGQETSTIDWAPCSYSFFPKI